MLEAELREQAEGRILCGVGGLYTVRLTDGTEVPCRAKGSFRHDGMTPLAGDRVRITLRAGKTGERETEARLEEILPRKNALIRPAMANLDVLFFVIAAKDPDPSLRFIDKMLSILEYNGIEPILVVTKADLDPEKADKLRIKYEKCGFTVIVTDSDTLSGDDRVADRLSSFGEDTVAAFSGVSGAGKSTLMNRLFPVLALETGEISEKIARGKHTTRAVHLYRLADVSAGLQAGYLADTPGFSMLDFARFDFFSCEALAGTFREFVPYLGHCRYTKCTHVKEDGCAILEAVAAKKVPKSRHTSYLELREALKEKKEWNK